MHVLSRRLPAGATAVLSSNIMMWWWQKYLRRNRCFHCFRLLLWHSTIVPHIPSPTEHSACVWLVPRTETHSPLKKASRQLYRIQWAIWTSDSSDRLNIWAGIKFPLFHQGGQCLASAAYLLNTGCTPCYVSCVCVGNLMKSQSILYFSFVYWWYISVPYYNFHCNDTKKHSKHEKLMGLCVCFKNHWHIGICYV